MAEIYFSTDVETDGPYPLDYSMLSFASAAFTAEGEMVGTFQANLETLPGARQHPDTMDFWARHPQAWASHRQNPKDPGEAIREYVGWLRSFPGKPVFVGYPAGFDFTWMHVYIEKFHGPDPFSWSALDVKSFAMAVLGTEFRETTKKTMPKKWFKKTPRHNHEALQDAVGQGMLFCNMLRAQKEVLGKIDALNSWLSGLI